MDISDCTFSMIFQPIPGIRRSAFEIEDRLSDYVKPFQVYALPDDAPFDLPRISAMTEGGHSTLTVAAQTAQVQTRFDESFSKEFKNNLINSKEKAIHLFDALSKMDNIDIYYVGLSVQLVVPPAEFGAQPVQFIKDTYLNVNSELTLSDASAKLVYSVDDDYYLNLEVKKVVLADPTAIGTSPDGMAALVKVAPHEEQLSVVIDFNNRLAFNSGRRPLCTCETIETLYQRALTFAREGIDAFLKNGEVRF